MNISVEKIEIGYGLGGKAVSRVATAFFAVVLVGGIAPKSGELIFDTLLRPILAPQTSATTGLWRFCLCPTWPRGVP